jgi:hypothetical protein
MTTITAAKIREQGTFFTVVLVKPSAIQQTPAQRDSVARGFSPIFPGGPVVLCAQMSGGQVQYWGRPDLVNFLKNVYLKQLLWAEYRTAA